MNRLVRKSFWILTLVAVIFTACKDKDAEKKIAALEAQLSEIEGKKGNAGHAENLTLPNAQTPGPEIKPEGPVAAMQFEKLEHDFGVIKEGDKVSYTYKFKNTGDAPLIIQSAQPTCGCTVPDWSKEPIPVGGEGFVKAEFDSQGKPDLQHKTVTVTANTFPKQTVLSFKAMVTPKNGQTPVQ